MRRTLSLPLIGLLLHAWTVSIAAAQASDSRTLTVAASAEVRAVPDRALVQLGVETQDSNAQAAMAKNSMLMQRVVAALQQVGIPPNQLQTSMISLTPIYTDARPPEPPRLIAFRASNVVTAQLTDLTKVGAAIDAGIGAGANQVQGISFGLADDLPFRLQALRTAGARARMKAEALAAGLGVTLGLVEAATEVGFQVTPLNERGAADVSTPVLPGELVVHVDIQVRYRISG
jgi:uncharacterized protein